MPFLSGVFCHAQEFNPSLSEKHLKKVEATENPVHKLNRYKRFYHRDSIKQWKELNRYWQAQTDKVADDIQEKEKAIAQKKKQAQDGIESRVYKIVYSPWAKRQANIQMKWISAQNFSITPSFKTFLYNYLTAYFLSATQDEEQLAVLKHRMPEVELPKPLTQKLKSFKVLEPEKFSAITDYKNKITSNEHLKNATAIRLAGNQYLGEFKKYSGYASNTDSVKGFVKNEAEKLGTEYLSSRVEGFSQLTAANQEMKKVMQMPGEYKNMADTAYVKQQAKQKAEEMAMEYISANPQVMKGYQAKMNVLMKKYSVVPNSTDLSSAVKKTSLQGRTFKERLVIGGNFQVMTIEPLTLDFSPLAGYRFTRKFIVGAGLNLRHSFGDSIPTLSPNVFGYKAFSSYDVFSNFFAYAEYNRNTTGITKNEFSSSRSWKTAAFLGIGRKFSIRKNVEMTMIFMYNFLYDHPDPIYPKRWNLKIGFQTSDLAFFKAKS
jgi:hypothetical protein